MCVCVCVCVVSLSLSVTRAGMLDLGAFEGHADTPKRTAYLQISRYVGTFTLGTYSTEAPNR